MDNICKKIKSILNSHNYINELNGEVKNHLAVCSYCESVFEDNVRLKRTLKRAVESTSVSEKLADQIMTNIKESEKAGNTNTNSGDSENS